MVMGMSRPVYRDKGQKLELARKFPYEIILDRHPDHVVTYTNPGRDPRKAWLYDGIASGAWMAEDVTLHDCTSFDHFGKRRYRFRNEQDAMMFSLRWVR